MFDTYPDVVSIEQVMSMLDIGRSSVYGLLKTCRLRHVRVGKKYIIPKQSVIDFVSGICYNDHAINSRSIQRSPKGV